MAFDPFIGWTETQLEQALREAQEDLAYGKTLASMGSGDSNAAYMREQNIIKRIDLLYRKLFTLNPTDYPLTSISRITRTRAVFGSQSSSSSS